MRLAGDELEEDRLRLLLDCSVFLEKDKHAHLKQKYAQKLESFQPKNPAPTQTISGLFQKLKSYIW